MDRIAITLLGPVRFGIGTRTLPPPRQGKVIALLAWLALEGSRTHRREHLAALLWPHLESAAALQNLRQTLLLLKQTLRDQDREQPWLRADRTSVWLVDAAVAPQRPWLDVTDFLQPAFAVQQPCAPGAGLCSACLASGRAAIELYRGDLLEAFHEAPELGEFSHWLTVQRRYFHRRALSLVDHLRQCATRLGDRELAAACARRYAQMEPLDETGARALMRAEAARGAIGDALAHYDETRRRLLDELGVEPELESRALYEALRREAERLPPPVDTPAAEWLERQATVLAVRLRVPGARAEIAAEHLRRARARVAAKVRETHGHLLVTGGDTLLAYFGVPAAQEGAAGRAVGAAWELSRMNIGAEARFGLHTGTLLFSGDPALPDATGAITAVAQQLCERTPAGRVGLTAATAETVARAFRSAPHGTVPVNGGMEEHLLVVAAAASEGRAPLIGRDAELAMLRERWHAARSGHGGTALVIGEAGIGKTRLLQALLEEAAAADMVVRRVECREETVDTPLFPVRELLRQVFAIDPQDDAEIQLACVEAYLDRYPLDRTEVLPLLADLLGLASPRYSPPAAPAMMRVMTRQLLIRLLQLLAQTQPVLLWVEDVHWADPSTLELLREGSAHLAAASIFLVMTARPCFAPATLPAADASPITLAPLDKDASLALLSSLTGRLSDAEARTIAERAEGVPFYLEELARHPGTALPPNLHDLFHARLNAHDRDDQQLIQAAAILGRHLDPVLLASVLERDVAPVHTTLRRLVDTGLVRHLRDPEDHFEFRHALLQEAAYRFTPAPARQRLHGRAAEVLRTRFPTLAARQPERVARHYEAALLYQPAAEAWLVTARSAAARGADTETVRATARGLTLLAHLEDAAARDALELELQLTAAPAHAMTRGFSATETRTAWERAFELSRAQPDRVFDGLFGLFSITNDKRRFAEAERLCHEMMRIAEATGRARYLAAAHFAFGYVLYPQGRIQASADHFAQVAAHSPRGEWESQQRHFTVALPLAAAAHKALDEWYLGRADTAQREMEAAVRACDEIADARTRVAVLLLHALLRRLLRDVDRAEAVAGEALSIAASHGLEFWAILARALLGWAAAQRGDPRGVVAIETIRRRLVETTGTGHSVIDVLLAEAACALGDHERALAVAEEEFQASLRHGSHYFRGELARLQGECHAARGAKTLAAERFQTALAVAAQCGLPALSLRAATSAARHLPSDADCRHQLETVYAGFVEGFATADLADAARLLASSDARPTGDF
jgi:DNA-binding SARP family transcriptional activator